MMNIHKALAVAVFGLALSIFCTQASAQLLTSPPPVYVSGGTTIYVQNGTGFTPLLTVANANFESLAIGPDNVDLDAASNPKHPFLLYACDTLGKSIIRIDPVAKTFQTVVAAGVLTITPVCGRSTATENVYVTDKSGPGVYRLDAPSGNSALGNFSFTAGGNIGATAVRIDTGTPMTGTGRGITQKYVGDLLVVDNADNQVWRAAYPPAPPPPPAPPQPPPPPLFSNPSPFITMNLNGPIGVANAPSLRDVFVSNSNRD